MDHAFLMIVLTLSSGNPTAAFVNTQTMEECERRAEVVRSILGKQDIEISQIVCRGSNAQFEPFVHGMEDDTERYSYSISFDAKSATIKSVAACENADESNDEGICATSTQKLLSHTR